jgi:hypothetical protein
MRDHRLVGEKQWNKNLDLPAEAYVEKLQTPFPRRPGMGALGKAIKVCINFFPLKSIMTRDVYIFDVSDLSSTY